MLMMKSTLPLPPWCLHSPLSSIHTDFSSPVALEGCPAKADIPISKGRERVRKVGCREKMKQVVFCFPFKPSQGIQQHFAEPQHSTMNRENEERDQMPQEEKGEGTWR